MIGRRELLASVAALGAGSSQFAFAQSWPNAPISLVSQFPAGTSQDVLLRSIADLVAADLKQSVVTENKPGGFGTAMSFTATQNPNGYTFGLVTSSTLVILPLIRKLGYDPLNDLTLVMQLATFPLGIAVKADSPFKSWPDVVAHAKTNPGKITFGTNSPDSMANLGMQRLLALAGISLNGVPFRGTMEVMTAVLGDQIDLMVSGVEWKPQVDAGAMRLLMMWTDKRLPAYASTPTARESGYPFDLDVSMALVAPKGLEPSVLSMAHGAFRRALESPSIHTLIEKYDMISSYADGATLKANLVELSADLRPVIDRLGMAAER